MLIQDGFVNTVKDAAPSRIDVSNPEQLEVVKHAESAKKIYDMVNEDCCAVLRIPSAIEPTKMLEGTHITMVSPRTRPAAAPPLPA